MTVPILVKYTIHKCKEREHTIYLRYIIMSLLSTFMGLLCQERSIDG